MIIPTPAEYADTDAVSFSRLKIFDRSPLLYRKTFVDKTVATQEETRAMRIGSAAHCMILECPLAFTEKFAIQPRTYTAEAKDGLGEEKTWNNNAKICQGWVAAQHRLGRSVVSADEAETLIALRESVRSNPDAVDLLRHGRAELAIRRTHPTLGLSIQGRLDWWIASGVVVDLKTIENLDDMRAEVEKRGYFRQLAFYRHLAAEEFGTTDIRCAIIGVEKSAPGRCGVLYLRDDLLAIGDSLNQASLLNLANCKASGDWGGNPPTVELGPSTDLLWGQMEAGACG